jgi:polyphosphate kinase
MSTLDTNPDPTTRGAGGDERRDVSPREFLNRELSWLEFNHRVLHEALDERTPLLERVRFLSIFTSNLDEFFMKRVGGLKRQVAAGIVRVTPDGRTVGQQLAAIRAAVEPMLLEQADCYARKIRPGLTEAGVDLLDWDKLSAEQRRAANATFLAQVFPVLTPLAVDPGHPFPFISNLSVSLGVKLQLPEGEGPLFARVKVPDTLPQWIELHSEADERRLQFVSLLDLIKHNLEELFPHMHVLGVMPFRVTRNADVERDEEDAEDLLEMVEQELRQRRFEQPVRLELGPSADRWLYEFVMGALELTASDVYELPELLDYTVLGRIADLGVPELKYEAWSPVVPAVLADEDTDIFAAVRSSDLLVHHPYESFGASVERFITSAADDPKVLAIKMTVYRTGDDSPFIHTMIRAAEAGKQVVCVVELKARFDEERNVHLAQALEKAGVHVVYGVVGYKTHTKMAVVVRSEADGLRMYVHIGTGNYHTGTAKLYTDLGLFTCDPQLTYECLQLFNYLTGRSRKKDYSKLLAAPVNMERRFFEYIEQERRHAEAGRPAHIIAKVNSLEHRGICRALYDASAAGVKVDLIVRGFCCLRPGVNGMSENIRVTSIVGRFLEHSRLFYFRNGAADPVEGDFLIGSADWMYRNLLARVEAVTPVEVRTLREKCWRILQILLEDRRQAWDMQSDGTYVQRRPATEDEQIGCHERLMRLVAQIG